MLTSLGMQLSGAPDSGAASDFFRRDQPTRATVKSGNTMPKPRLTAHGNVGFAQLFLLRLCEPGQNELLRNAAEHALGGADGESSNEQARTSIRVRIIRIQDGA